MPTIEEMAAKGQAKLQRKATTMAASYEAAKTRAVQNFQAVGFGPTRTSNYQAGVQAAQTERPIPGSGPGTGRPRCGSNCAALGCCT